MPEHSCISSEHRRLIRTAGINILRPQTLSSPAEYASAQTTARAGVPVLTGFRYEVREDESDRSATVEVTTFVRGGILATRGGTGEDDGVVVWEYLEREARLALAARSLELAEGAAEHLTRPLGEMILERKDVLPAPSETTLTVDGVERVAHAISFDGHAAVWSDLPDARLATIVYTRRWPTRPSLVTLALSD